MNLLVIGIGHEKDLIIGYRYRFKFFISCIPNLNSICLCRTLFMNRWRCIKQYIKSVSVAHENVSEMSVYLRNIAFNSLHL